ncbi:MAG: sodium:solute symporter family protein [Ruminococcaceae bacterium]|nr:sodium:solute symporter family protein [Oscillospiraceae bacterium]
MKNPVIVATICIYIVIMAAISFLGSKKSKNMSDFTVGGRNAGAWMSAFSYGTAYFSAVMFIGYAGGTGWQYGIWGVLPGIGNAIIGSLFAWLVLAKRTRTVTRERGITSMPQLFDKSFGSRGLKLFSAIVIFVFLVPYSASVYKGLTSVCSVLLDLPEMVCMIIIAAASAIIVVAGGYIAALRADFVQGLVMLAGVIALIVAVLNSKDGASANMQSIVEKTKALNLSSTQHLGLWATVLMTSFGTWGLPQMVHKYYGIRDDKEVKRGTVISTVFALVVAGGGYFIGSLSRLFYDNLDSFPNQSTDYLIPNMLKDANIHSILVGVILVLLIAASVSTLSSITITASSTFTMDIVQDRFIKDKSKDISVLTKGVCFAFVVISFLIAWLGEGTPILDMMSYSWGIISGSFLAPYAVSLYWKKITKAGAWTSVLGGFITALPPLAAKLVGSDIKLGSLGEIHKLGPHFACLAMIVSFVLLFAVSALTQKKVVEE